MNFFSIRFSRFFNLLLPLVMVMMVPVLAEDTTKSTSENSRLSVSDILDRVEKRYAWTGFSADFYQESTIKTIDITDTAEGKLYVKRPDKMRWEYTAPDVQIIISDGLELWVFRPADNQVMMGKAPAFFGGGKGAGFLTDVRSIREQFDVSIAPQNGGGIHVLKLVPRSQTAELAAITLTISDETFDVMTIVTENTYGDETRITLTGLQLNADVADALFTFEVPEGAEILELESR
ncbi:MAG: outer membrane lipoprotein carrier protein LolA [Desulfobacteraceae bacterium]|nr:outer membrane lipoprotein carrier protein LolA [Desulfobacteraceae bacterium]